MVHALLSSALNVSFHSLAEAVAAAAPGLPADSSDSLRALITDANLARHHGLKDVLVDCYDAGLRGVHAHSGERSQQTQSETAEGSSSGMDFHFGDRYQQTQSETAEGSSSGMDFHFGGRVSLPDERFQLPLSATPSQSMVLPPDVHTSPGAPVLQDIVLNLVRPMVQFEERGAEVPASLPPPRLVSFADVAEVRHFAVDHMRPLHRGVSWHCPVCGVSRPEARCSDCLHCVARGGCRRF